MKNLLLFSGGADSSYIAYKILSETNEPLTTVTWTTSDVNNNWANKAISMHNFNDLVAELKKIRDFDVIIHDVASSRINDENNHHILYGIEWASEHINNSTYDRLVTGRTWEQQNQSLFKGKEIKGTPTHFASINLWNKLMTRGEMIHPLADDAYHDQFNRYHVFTYLPEAIRSKTISCFSPILNGETDHVSACGECYKCLWDEKVLQLTQNGYGSSQINAWRRIKSLEYGGGNNLSAPIRYWLPVEMGKGNIYRVRNVDNRTVTLDTKSKIQHHTQTTKHYTIRNRPETGIWDFTNFIQDDE